LDEHGQTAGLPFAEIRHQHEQPLVMARSPEAAAQRNCGIAALCHRHPHSNTDLTYVDGDR